jgi:protein-tyrosine kinase
VSLIERALARVRGAGSEPQPVRAAIDLPMAVSAVRESSAALAKATEEEPRDQRFSKIVQVDPTVLRAAGLLPPVQREHDVARQYRRIKLPLLEQARKEGASGDARARLIFVSSALPGEGKTFSTVNLAFSMAREKDIDVLLIDGDVAKPHVTRAFSLDGEPGLVNALMDESTDPESLIIGTDIPGLTILPAGAFSEDSATELLASNRMRQVVEQILRSRRRRIVVIDSPPLLLTTESKVLAGLAGQIIIVVKAGSTPQHAVFESLDMLGEEAAIGFILNQAQASIADKYVGYPGYGSYASYGGYGTYGTSSFDGSLPGSPRGGAAGAGR